MSNLTEIVIKYWQASLQDAELSSLNLTDGNNVRVSFDDLRAGQINIDVAAAFFKDADKESQDSSQEDSDDTTMPVIVVPIVASKGGRGRYKRQLCPLLLPAQLGIDGRLRPEIGVQRPWIPRPLLEPTSSDLVLGNIDSLDEFWIDAPEISSDEDLSEKWPETLDLAWQLLAYVSNQWKSSLKDAGYRIENKAAIINTSNVWGMAANILRVYDYALKQKTLPPLLQEIARIKVTKPQQSLPIKQWLAPAKLHSGSFSKQFPLSPSQREALYHLFLLSGSSVLAVSGPPGTGKTTLLHSVIASLWVTAALREGVPPVIVASSTNNQAVTNVIDSLSGGGGGQRWLPISGFGLYLVNTSSKQKEASQRGILTLNKYGDGFPKDIENASFVVEAKKQFLEACSKYVGHDITSVETAIEALHRALVKLNYKLTEILETAYALADLEVAQRKFVDAHGSVPAFEARCLRQVADAKVLVAKYRRLHVSWLNYVRDEPTSHSVLGFVPGIKRKRTSGYQLFLNEHLPDEDVEPSHDAIALAIQQRIKEAEAQVSKYEEQMHEFNVMLSHRDLLTDRWERFCLDSDARLEWEQLLELEIDGGGTNEANVHIWLDTSIRYEMFEIATHYWEGRWLQQIEDDDIAALDFKESRNQPTQERKWRRYAMLTPCFVTTMHTGPSFFSYYDGKPNPLLNYVDLLIVDEAGQVTPEVSGAMFALAKQALIVGDVKQIEPVWSIPLQVDLANVVRHKLGDDESGASEIEASGIMASSGSVMQMAQKASPFQIAPRNGNSYERGMFLAEHRRCVPEIIGYCNELAYNGRLRPMRPSLETHPWPYLGYVHIKGEATIEQGSRLNGREARSIAGWIADNKNDLEAHYQTQIEQIVGIVTPFAAQKRAIQKALAAYDISLSKVGTVHALQGGERPVVLFSSVYSTRDSSRYFFDRGPNMLNVAVSRAKDSFIVFGDMEIFDPHRATPSGILAKYLFADEANEMLGVPVSSRIEAQDDIGIHHVRTLDMHVRSLNRAFERVGDRLAIVSPYLRWRAVESDNICNLVMEAVSRGAKVDIYVDMDFNNDLELPSAAAAAKALEASGASMHVCRNIHSKIVCIDQDVFIEGSFNWLSAERRVDELSRYETSLIYTGPQASEFINEVLVDIEQRIIRSL